MQDLPNKNRPDQNPHQVLGSVSGISQNLPSSLARKKFFPGLPITPRKFLLSTGQETKRDQRTKANNHGQNKQIIIAEFKNDPTGGDRQNRLDNHGAGINNPQFFSAITSVREFRHIRMQGQPIHYFANQLKSYG